MRMRERRNMHDKVELLSGGYKTKVGSDGRAQPFADPDRLACRLGTDGPAAWRQIRGARNSKSRKFQEDIPSNPRNRRF